MKTSQQYLQEAKEQIAEKNGHKHHSSIMMNIKLIDEAAMLAIENAQREAQPKERFIMPTDKQFVEMAILFNEGNLNEEKLTDMVAMAEFMIDRLYENGNVDEKSSKEID